MKREISATFAKTLEHKYTGDKDYRKNKDHCHYTGNTVVLHIAYVI